MALVLNFSVIEQNDNKVITFTDTSTGWGTGTDPNYTAIAAVPTQTYSLLLDITVNTPSGVVIYDTIDLYGKGLHTPFTVQGDLVFALDSSIITSGGNVLGDNNTLLIDGIWDVTYRVQHYTGGIWVTISTKTISLLVDGQVTKAVYDKLRLVPMWTDSDTNRYRDIQEAGYYYTYLQSIEKSAFIARKDELIQMLETLQRLLINGSNYPW
jgi:hypothetical protein